MQVINGKGISPGIAIGPLRFYTRQPLVEEKRPVANRQAELARFRSARAKAAEQLGVLAVTLTDKIGQENALLFEIHKMMLEDADYSDSVEGIITDEGLWAEYAVSETARKLAKAFAEMDGEYMQARAADVQDISLRVLQILSGHQLEWDTGMPASIIAGEDFAPSETAQFDREKVLAILTQAGSSNSHTAIFARTMGIPAIAGLGGTLPQATQGCTAVVNGATGEVILQPDEATLAQYRQMAAEEIGQKARLQSLKSKDAVSLDGQRIDIYANIGGVEDAKLAVENGAGGIGLFRSEFLFLQSKTYPTEQQQLAAYKAVAEAMDGRRVVIRTLDIGADKQVDYFQMDKEENPALGYRAIRICLDRPEVFLTQLRAIYRASAFGKVAIMLPMVTAAEEVRQAKAVAAKARAELAAEGIAFDESVEIGIMVETPAAAIISDDLAKEADFFSIGTNDLTQYTLAVDRQNPKLEGFYNPHHKALLRMVKLAADNIHKEGKWIGICGELAADESLTEVFLAMGIDELSMPPSRILPIKDKVLRTEIAAKREALLAGLTL